MYKLFHTLLIQQQKDKNEIVLIVSLVVANGYFFYIWNLQTNTKGNQGVCTRTSSHHLVQELMLE